MITGSWNSMIRSCQPVHFYYLPRIWQSIYIVWYLLDKIVLPFFILIPVWQCSQTSELPRLNMKENIVQDTNTILAQKNQQLFTGFSSTHNALTWRRSLQSYPVHIEEEVLLLCSHSAKVVARDLHLYIAENMSQLMHESLTFRKLMHRHWRNH